MALLGLLVVVALDYGDPDVAEGLRVVNRTDEPVLISTDSGGSRDENFISKIPSGSFLDTGFCGRITLVARRQNGDLIGRRAPSESCADEWVVRGAETPSVGGATISAQVDVDMTAGSMLAAADLLPGHRDDPVGRDLA